MDAIEKSRREGVTVTLILALLTDGLKAEREQGITIDIAYKYFGNSKEKVYHCRCPRAYTVYPQHGNRRIYSKILQLY